MAEHLDAGPRVQRTVRIDPMLLDFILDRGLSVNIIVELALREYLEAHYGFTEKKKLAQGR